MIRSDSERKGRKLGKRSHCELESFRYELGIFASRTGTGVITFVPVSMAGAIVF